MPVLQSDRVPPDQEHRVIDAENLPDDVLDPGPLGGIGRQAQDEAIAGEAEPRRRPAVRFVEAVQGGLEVPGAAARPAQGFALPVQRVDKTLHDLVQGRGPGLDPVQAREPDPGRHAPVDPGQEIPGIEATAGPELEDLLQGHHAEGQGRPVGEVHFRMEALGLADLDPRPPEAPLNDMDEIDVGKVAGLAPLGIDGPVTESVFPRLAGRRPRRLDRLDLRRPRRLLPGALVTAEAFGAGPLQAIRSALAAEGGVELHRQAALLDPRVDMVPRQDGLPGQGLR